MTLIKHLFLEVKWTPKGDLKETEVFYNSPFWTKQLPITIKSPHFVLVTTYSPGIITVNILTHLPAAQNSVSLFNLIYFTLHKIPFTCSSTLCRKKVLMFFQISVFLSFAPRHYRETGNEVPPSKSVFKMASYWNG